MTDELLKTVKNHLSITWTDDETEKRVKSIVEDAEDALNHKLGASVDYESGGQARRLFLAFCLYLYNGCEDEFDAVYRTEINQIRERMRQKEGGGG